MLLDWPGDGQARRPQLRLNQVERYLGGVVAVAPLVAPPVLVAVPAMTCPPAATPPFPSRLHNGNAACVHCLLPLNSAGH